MFLNKKILLTLTIFLLSCLSMKAQPLQASLSHYSTDNGLSSNAIAQITQDDYGFIWIATWNGLSRFDGYEFYNYKTGNASHIPNLHNRISSLVIDHQQNVWMKMYDGRVFVLNRQIDKIINPFEDVSSSDEYRASCDLFLMSNGHVLGAFTGVGIYQMKLENGVPNMDLITTNNYNIRCIAEGYHDDIWVGTNKGLHRIDIGNMSIERKGLFEDEEVTAIFSNGYNIYVGCKSGAIYVYSYGQEPQQLRQATGKEILSVYLDSHGIVWFADVRDGANRLKNGDEKHFEQIVLVPEHDGIGGGFNEVNGYVWIRMNRGGYGYYNRETDEVEYFHNDPSNPWNLSNTVNATKELAEGVIFMSTSRRGLEKLEILRNNITRTLLLPDSDSPIDNEIRGMFYDKKRKLLFLGNKNNMVFIIRPDGSRVLINKDEAGNPIGRIYGIAQDSKGNYWFSSKDYGLLKVTTDDAGNVKSIKHYSHDDNDKFSLSNNAAYLTVEDSDGNIWVATYGGGVNLLTHDKNGKAIFLNPLNEMRKYPKNSFLKVRTVAIDKNGIVWAGTTDGILLMSYKNKKLSIEKLQNSEENPDQILMSTDVVNIARDKFDEMWIGTNGGGVAHTVGQDSKGTWLFESFGYKDGLPSEEIKSITFDLSGNVWFATDHILCSYNISKKIFTTFSSLDGVDETMCSEGAAITLPNGNILFGTLNGYYTVDRKKLVTNNGSMLKLRITDFYINNELASPNLNDYFDYYVPDAKRVELKEHNTTFAFRFSAMNYQLQHRIHYQYKLEGYDMDWRTADKSRMASYTDVPAGTYHFRVKAFMLESPDKYDMRMIEVVVPPYFLLSSNAVWIYMILVFSLGLGLMFWRQNRLKKKQNLKVLKLGPQEMAFIHQEDYDFVKAQLDWLEQNYANPELKTDDLVEQSKLSREEYISQLKELTDQTPKEFINDFRLKKAVMLLENTEDTVEEIAKKTGFAEPLDLTRTFKQMTGLTPTKYREQKKKEIKNEANEEKTDDYELVEE